MTLTLDALMKAVRDRDLDGIDPYLEDEGEEIINSSDEHGQTPLTLAASLGYQDVVYDLLRSMFCVVEQPDANGDVAIEIAIARSNKDLVRAILDSRYVCNDAERLGLITRADLALDPPEQCTMKMAALILKSGHALTEAQRSAYESQATPDPQPAEDSFDVEKMAVGLIKALEQVGASHPQLRFAAFAIDAGLCCLNTIDNPSQGVSTGDWSHQGFFELKDGYDEEAYQAHYDASDEEQGTSAYRVARQALLEELARRDAFAPINKTEPFSVFLAEHEY